MSLLNFQVRNAPLGGRNLSTAATTFLLARKAGGWAENTVRPKEQTWPS